MPTSGSFGCANREVAERGRFRHHAYSAVLGGFSDPGAAAPPPTSTAIRQKVAAAIPGKEIVIGEFGWPSAGRMREGARPSPSNQARAHSGDDGARAAGEFPRQYHRGFRSAVEAAAGRRGRRLLGHHRPRHRRTEIQLSAAAVSDHPHWLLQAAAGILLAALIFAGAWFAGRGKGRRRCCGRELPRWRSCPPCCSAGLLETVPIDSFGAGRLAALACVRAHRGRGADCLRGRLRRRPRRARASPPCSAGPATRARSARTGRSARTLIALILLLSKPRSAWCSIRATATCRSRR